MQLKKAEVMNMHSDPDTIDSGLAGLAEMRSSLEPHIQEMEELCHLPQAVVDKLRQIGIFRMLAPRRFGGQEMGFPSALELIRRISTVDASIAWVAAINSSGCLILPKLPLASLERIYGSGPDQIIAGSAQAQGVGKRVAGGWQITGRWPLASGCMAAEWILTCFKEDQALDPVVSAALLPANECRIEQTWRAMGLRGTGSHHICLDDVFVADDFVFSISAPPLALDGPLYRQPAHLIALMHGAVQLGVAQAAVMDVMDLLRQGSLTDKEGRRELAQFELGVCHAKLKATESAFEQQVKSDWANALEMGPVDPLRLAATVQLGVFIARATLDIVRRCFELAGSIAVYEHSPLQRRLRDIQVATQHGLISRANFIAGGKALMETIDLDLRNSGIFDAR
ncbi:hypothetical protein EHI47_36620 [Rhizobium leguminosarum]|uniref:Acyl-CoA dehydrogenase n=3 Tax=Rhizobium leguminosarum TaxID=384 RepID=A0A444HIM4_RHILE|nr:acyl-CoA dehydrogenase family protein [Rhizobium leguminosarum]RWX21307.1 hypothetical protein EHI47_36620 [Rhizobium leguminosarum]